MVKILVNFPSRSRPQKFFKILNDYHSKSSGKYDIHYYIKIDADDKTMNNDMVKERIKSMGISYQLDILTDCKGKIDAINRGINGKDFDILISIADDLNVLENNWDDIIVHDMDPDFSICLNYKSDERVIIFTDLIVIPVIGKKLYDRFGYIYHPDYMSEWCDNEQTQVCYSLGKLAIYDTCIIQHQWTHEPFDELHARNENREMYDVDRITFEKRAAINFDLGAVS